MIQKVDHIGIAVADLDAAISLYRDILGLDFDGIEDVPGQKVRIARMLGGDDVIELMVPLGDDSPIRKFLDRRGPGLHHVCLVVDDIRAALRRFAERGLKVIDAEPRPGAGGALVAFVHPRSTGGVLIELSQRRNHGV